MYDMENSVMNRDFKGQNPYAAAMNAAYGFSGKYDEKDFQLPPAIMSMHNGPAAAAAAAAFYSSRMPVPAAYSKPMWRKGKWLDEEEAYTKKLIEAFNNGYLNISSGTTLRSFLSERLSCDPMRITKKFAGSSCIGKQVYTPCDLKTVDHTVIAKIQDELKELEDKFRAKVDVQRALDYYSMGAPAAAFTPIHPAAFHAPRMAYLEGIPPEYYATLPGQGPLPHMMANPFMMKMYGGQDMQMPFMYQTHPQTAKYSPSYHPIDVNQEYRSDNANIPVVPIANLKSKSSRSSDEVKSNESNKKAKTEKKPKTTTQPKPSSESNAKGNGIPGDLDASDLLLNFFKAANETSSKSRSNSCEGFETAKFDEKTKDSAASISSSTLTSASNLVGMISSASSEADNEEDISDAPEEEEDNNEPTSLLAKRDSRDDYDQYETLGNNSNPAKRIRQSDV